MSATISTITHTLQSKAGISDEEYRTILMQYGGVTTSKKLSKKAADEVIDVLRELAGEPSRSAQKSRASKRTPTENKIWWLWYQLKKYLPENDRNNNYLLGIINKITSGENIPGLVNGYEIRLAYLGPRWTCKVINGLDEALKQRLTYERQRQGEIEE